MPPTSSPASRSQRIVGYDLARALAILGMVLVNFRIVLMLQGIDVEGSGIGGWLAGWLSGRAAATFVVLAGVGVSLLTRRALQDPGLRPATRRRLLKRALFFAAIGWPFLVIWEGDILHYYAAFFLVAAFTFTWSSRRLALAALAVTLGALPLRPLWPRHWDLASLEYQGLWTWEGQFLNLFVNGFHPLLPWLTFLFLGMLLGRHLDRRPSASFAIGVGALGVVLLTETVSHFLVSHAIDDGMQALAAKARYGTSSMPPMPQYVLAAGSFAIAVICACRGIGARFGGRAWLQPLIHFGRFALSMYILHVFFGVFPLFEHSLKSPQLWDLGRCVLAALGFCVAVMALQWVWRLRFPHWPAEWLMRRFSDAGDRRSLLALLVAILLMATPVQLLREESWAQDLPDEAEFSSRCTRWVLDNPVVSVWRYDGWAEEHFGSTQEFEEVWLRQIYFEYADEAPMEEREFQLWLTERVQEHLVADGL